MVILEACRQHAAQVTLIEDDDVIETFAMDRAGDAELAPAWFGIAGDCEANQRLLLGTGGRGRARAGNARRCRRLIR